MKKIALILGVILLSLVTYYAVSASITREARAILKTDCPELHWLKSEYQLTEDQFSRIRKLHETHDVICLECCKKLSSSQNAVKKAIVEKRNTGPDFQALLDDWRQHQKESQDLILKHMFEVSAEMNADQAERYRERVFENLILAGRNPHIDSNGEFDPEFIQHLDK